MFPGDGNLQRLKKNDYLDLHVIFFSFYMYNICLLCDGCSLVGRLWYGPVKFRTRNLEFHNNGGSKARREKHLFTFIFR